MSRQSIKKKAFVHHICRINAEFTSTDGGETLVNRQTDAALCIVSNVRRTGGQFKACRNELIPTIKSQFGLFRFK